MNKESQFLSRIAKLNKSQREAVETTEGAVMVVAGPGTGKTELLSMRAANILRRHDINPSNILCLTFTESGTIAMQKRLFSIIGKDAYNVHIHTFHEFGNSIISKYSEYFYNGADLSPATSIDQNKIITEIIEKSEHDSPFRKQFNGEYTFINDLKNTIKDFKGSGFTPEELRKIIKINMETTKKINPSIDEIFSSSSRISMKTVEASSRVLENIKSVESKKPNSLIKNIKDIIFNGLFSATNESLENNSHSALKDWRDKNVLKNIKNSYELKMTEKYERLLKAVDVYEKYDQKMKENRLYDFSDMILDVIHAIEKHPDLKYELQESFQYIMVDEFQDTNLAQMRIIHNLTDNEVNEGNPNLLVVGDDDQAIYGFQGAEVGNILDFKEKYPRTKLITLNENYRSTPSILDVARQVIVQGQERLENKIENLNKRLNPNSKAENKPVSIVKNKTLPNERLWIVDNIKKKINSGVKAGEIAIIARRHRDLIDIVPLLAEQNIPIKYEKRENVLENEIVIEIENLARLISNISEQNYEEANALMPKVLVNPAWNIPAETIWKIGLKAKQNRKSWLEILQDFEELNDLARWIIEMAKLAPNEPLEKMLDRLIGLKFKNFEEDDFSDKNENNTENKKDFISPYADYYFPELQNTDKIDSDFVDHIENLSAIRNKIREQFDNSSKARLKDFIQIIDDYRAAKENILKMQKYGDQDSVNLMSAHASKGLEFDIVYVINSVENVWVKSSGKKDKITYPENLPLSQNKNTPEEFLRLFFVAMTRAKKELYLTYSEKNENDKEILLASFLSEIKNVKKIDNQDISDEAQAKSIIEDWYAPIVKIDKATMHDLLAPTLEHYKLSATHVNSFLDIEHGGPKAFLINNILRFPSSQNPTSIFGTAMHKALQNAHESISVKKEQLSIDKIIEDYKENLKKYPLDQNDYKVYADKGEYNLKRYLGEKYDSFNERQRAELDFNSQNVYIGEARLTGKLDVVTINEQEKTIEVVDYKTGSALKKWGSGPDYIKIKSHKYRQQLIFYKLLVDNSRDYSKYNLTKSGLDFIIADDSGDFHKLDIINFETLEVERLKKLIDIIWEKIMNLDFPDTSNYGNKYKDLLQFEDDLIERKI